MAEIAALILAAGASVRFGSPKQLVRVGERTLLEAVAETAAGELQPVLAVVPPGMAVPPAVVPVINGRPELGLSHSLRLGIAAVPPEIDAVVVLLGDQPTVAGDLLRRLLAARGQSLIVATVAGDVAAPPLLLERRAFPLAAEGTGDAGLRDILRSRSDLVTPIEISQHAPDIDQPGDLASIAERCPGCGAWFEPLPGGATRAYLGASPACWAAFSELIAREFSDPAYGRVHRHTVDAYAVQHPGNPGRRQQQSVAVHLVALCHWLEHGFSMERLNPITQRLTARKDDWPWLDPPSGYEMTVLDALSASSGEEHADLVRRWAASVWEAWSEHHDRVREWAALALD
jgi:CTP:molybdopterin cytidylyltransferase MocA